MVKWWNIFLIASTNMIREALIMPGPYVASSVAGSIIAYAMSLSSQWSVFGFGIGVAVAYGLASMEVLSVRTLIKLWRVKTNAFYVAFLFSGFALLIEWLILGLADNKLPWVLRIVGFAFCVLPGIMYLLQALHEWTDEQIGTTQQKEQVIANLEIERRQKEQAIELEKLAEKAKWEIEQERIKLENTQQKALAKISAKNMQKHAKKEDYFALEKEGLTNTEIANILGVTTQTIRNWKKE